MKRFLIILFQVQICQLLAQVAPEDKCQRYFHFYEQYTRSIPQDDELSDAEKKETIKMYKDSVQKLRKELLEQGPIWEQCNLRFFHAYANQLMWDMRYKKARRLFLQLYELEKKNITWQNSSFGRHSSNAIHTEHALQGLSNLYFHKERWFEYIMLRWFHIRIRKQKAYVLCGLGGAELQSRTDHKSIRKIKKKEGTRMALDYTCQIGVWINSSIFEPYQMEDIYLELLREYYSLPEIKAELDRNIADCIQKSIAEKDASHTLGDGEQSLAIPIFDTHIYLSKPFEVYKENGTWENPVVREVLLNKLYNSLFYRSLKLGKERDKQIGKPFWRTP